MIIQQQPNLSKMCHFLRLQWNCEIGNAKN